MLFIAEALQKAKESWQRRPWQPSCKDTAGRDRNKKQECSTQPVLSRWKLPRQED